jgi:hypothetical protein
MAKEKGNHSPALSAEMVNDEVGAKVKAAKGSLTYSGVLQTGFVPNEEFTGKVFGIVQRPHNGFANFAIAELLLEKGRVVGAHYLQPMAGVELRAKLDIRIGELLDELRKAYPEGFGLAVV